MNDCFHDNTYSLWHLFRDRQRHILHELLETTWQQIEASFRHIYEHNYTIMQIMRGMNIPLPKALSTPAEFILNQDLCREIRSEEISVARLQALAEGARRLSLQLDEATIRFTASRKIDELMSRFEESPSDVDLLETIESAIRISGSIVSELDLQKAQNIFFALRKEYYPEMRARADRGDQLGKKWIEHFNDLARSLGVVVQ